MKRYKLLSLALSAAFCLSSVLSACHKAESSSTASNSESTTNASVTATTPAGTALPTDLNGNVYNAATEDISLKGHIFSANELEQKLKAAQALDNDDSRNNNEDVRYFDSNGALSAFERAKAAGSGLHAKHGDSLAKYSNEQQSKVDSFFGPLPLISQLSLLRHYKARAIYINNGEKLAENINLVNNSELNSVVINVKADSYFYYPTKIKQARKARVMIENNDNLAQKIAKLKAANIHVIGKVSCFRDTLMARNYPDFAIKDKEGTVINWAAEGESAFLNPYNMNVWRYLRDIVYEAIDLGVDEILLDQVRFPLGVAANEAGSPYYGEEDVLPDKVATLARFLEFMRVEVSDKLGVALSASMYDIQDESSATSSGQAYTTFTTVGLDSITPNLFPADYASDSTWMGNGVGTEINGVLFKAPDLEPYNVINATVNQYINRYKQTSKTFYRPYLQAFTAYYLPRNYWQEYKPEQIAAEIQALKDNAVDEYILWNSEGNYSAQIFSHLLNNTNETK